MKPSEVWNQQLQINIVFNELVVGYVRFNHNESKFIIMNDQTVTTNAV